MSGDFAICSAVFIEAAEAGFLYKGIANSTFKKTYLFGDYLAPEKSRLIDNEIVGLVLAIKID